nr:Ig-like domain-containing protein [Paenibacillus qinlingensis]
MSGSGWTCTYNTLTCTRSDIPQGQSAYAPIDLTVNVAANAARTITSSVTVSGGAEIDTTNNSGSFVTTILNRDAKLYNLIVSKGTLTPDFDSNTMAYTVSLPYADDTLKMMPTVNESHATVTVNTGAVESGAWSEAIPLQVGNTEINITVRAEDGTTATTVLTVSRAIPVSSIAVSGANDATIVMIGNSLQMSTDVSPGNATNKSVTWSVEAGTGNATIDETTGLLLGTVVGDVVVKATAIDGSGIVGTKSITIAPRKVTSIDVMSQGEASSVQNGEQLQMSALVYPENATNRTVVWSVVPGTGNAEINESTGLLTGTGVGEVVVKASATDDSGIVGTMNIEITKIPVTGIEVISESETTNVRNGKTLQLRALVSPDEATDRTVAWSVVPGTGNASIDASGVLTGTEVGTVTVISTANDNPDINGTLEVTIKAIPVTGILVTSEGELTSVSSGKTLQMIAVVSPDDATDRTVAWSIVPGTGNASIDASGVLTGTEVGTVTVIATANDNPDINGTMEVTILPILVTSIDVSSENNITSVPNGSTLQMSEKVLPGNATNAAVTWSVEAGTGTATISSSGELRGTSLGTVIVKATANDESAIVGTMTITITPILVTSINVTSEDNIISIPNGSTLQMSEKVLPGNATNTSVTWSVEAGTGTATISLSGLLTGTTVGTVTVKATAKDGSNIVGSKIITIEAIPLTSIVVTGEDEATSVPNGSTLQMIAAVLPENATNASVTWSVVAGTGTATISPTGELTGTGVGTVTVKATANDGSNVVGSKIISVAAIPVTSIVVTGTGDATTVTNGHSLQMKAAVWPDNASHTDVTWSVVANTGNATISVTGLLTGTQVGTVTVIATATDGSATKGITIITIAAIPVSHIEVKGAGDLTSVVAGNTLQMIANLLPENATNPSVTWSVYGNPGVATISDLGILNAIEPGNVTITATATDGSGVKGSTAITITPIPEVPVMTISISVKETSNRDAVVIGGTLQLEASVLPLNVTNSSVTWYVYGNGNGNTGNALISQSGLLTATGIGTVTVEARANDGSGIIGKKVITITSDAPQIKLSPISTKVQGEVVELQGTTNLNGLTLTILAPNGTVLASYQDVTVANGTFHDARFALPADTEAGMYTLIANNGIISTHTSFAVILSSTFALLDHDHNGQIQFDEIITYIQSDSPTRDLNLDGRIDREDITFILSLIPSMKD